MKVLVASHGHCFDGLCSAALFTALLRKLEGPGLEFQYRACGYGIGQPTAEAHTLDGEVNAVLDYRYTASERVTWYFDHHRTAFASPEDRRFFEAQAARSNRHHFDASCSSCTKLIHQVARDRFAVDTDCEQLVALADVVDSAAFGSAEAAISKADPAMRLVSVVEHHGNDAFFARYVPLLLDRPLAELARSPEIERLYGPIGARLDHFVSAVRTKAEQQGRVVFVDLTEKPLELIGKFVTYALFPNSVYSVVVAKVKRGFKISVGYNPWCGQRLDTDISSICARFGGGGHSVVGGISVPDGERDRAQSIARSIASELDG
jgi:hypothetical protein